jgi:hypothetical protein
MTAVHPTAVVANSSQALAWLGAGPFPPALQSFIDFVGRSQRGIAQ